MSFSRLPLRTAVRSFPVFGRCPYAVEVARDTYVGCALKAGHDGPCKSPREALGG